MAALLAGILAQGASRGSSVRISNFGRVDDRYYRGAQPSGHDYKDLSSMGIKTVIDLQSDGPSDEAGQVKNAGMRFYRIPMSDHSRPSDGAVRQFLQLVNDPANQPVFVHCHGGRHRTGAMTAVYRMTHYGWNASQAYGEMQQYDFNHGFGHGALKDFVFSYYSQVGQNQNRPATDNNKTTRSEGPGQGGQAR
jgi:protein tyrosine/serine phosphatase